jgi:Ca-activated chloride channel family protein
MKRAGPVLFLSVLSLSLFSSQASAQSAEISQRDREWLAEVDPLVTQRERRVFLGLNAEPEREAFIEGFWQARDPYPQTPRNELREQWETRFQEARQRWGGLADDRSRVFLLQGSPTTSFQADCPGTGAYEVWIYEPRFQEKYRTVLVFLRGAGASGARLWRPGAPGFDPKAVRADACVHGAELAEQAQWIRWAGAEPYTALLERVLARPRPREWISSFVPLSFEPTDSVAAFGAGLDVEFAGRQEDKVVVRVLLTVAPSALPAGETAEGDHEFLLAGRVLQSGQPLERFLYRFHARPQAAGLAGQPIPLTFERHLPPGRYTLDVKLEHVATRSIFQKREEIAVPDLKPASAPETPPAVSAIAAIPASAVAPEPAPPESAAFAAAFAEADAALSARRPSLRLSAPPGALLSGPVRFQARLEGAPEAAREIRRVAFFLDGKPLLARTRPPYELQIDLGPAPKPQRLVAEGLSENGTVLARDELLMNGGMAGLQPLRVKLLEPQSGKPYRRSVRAAVDVDAPAGEKVQQVDLYLGERKVATLYQPPFTQPILLEKDGQVDYVRAVATLANGATAEDLVLINAPASPDAIDVRLVELYAAVHDGQGRPVTGGLDGGAFQVVEDGVPQQLRRVDTVAETPLRLVTLLDTSGSMAGRMAASRQAALDFLRHTLRPQDQAAVITFNRTPRVEVPFTADLAELEDGLDGVTAGDETALWDSLIYSLFYLNGAKGQRAVLLLSDGMDRTSRFTAEQALESARRAGIAVYSIGLALDQGAKGAAAQQLAKLAAVTGGRAYFADGTAELAGVYGQIENDLRSQWRLAYQSSNTKTDGGFRTVQVKVEKAGLEARTISGYYP